MNSPEPSISTEQARDMLQAAGLRRTSCRIAVLKQLGEAAQPVSHNEVADVLTPQGFDKSTVYRSLVEFAEVGLASKLDLGDHVWRFELVGEHVDENHPHFVCTECGKVTCLDGVSVRIVTKRGAPEPPEEISEVLIKGKCAKC